MEGLIPMVYKAIKKNRIRRQYTCLSIEAAQTYHLPDFNSYSDLDHRHHDRVEELRAPSMDTNGEIDSRRGGHRRFSSAGDFEINDGRRYGFSNDDINIGRQFSPPHGQIQLKRYRSHRLFSCITGAT